MAGSMSKTAISPLVYAKESAIDAILEIEPLARDHYNEIAVHMGEPYDPDWNAYRLMEQAGYLRVYTARDDGRLVGYAVFFLRPHQHSKASMQAFSDLLYIARESRGHGHDFIRWCDLQLKADGARVVYQSVTPYCDFSKTLERLGYEDLGRTFGRRL